jgi:small subunit ribosomal protein S6
LWLSSRLKGTHQREYWGLRGLAYRIKKNHRGHYMLIGLDATPAFVNEMERLLRLNDDILRFLTLNVDNIEEGPSVILSRKDDESDRNFRGPKPAARFDSRRRSFEEGEYFRARNASGETPSVDPAPSSLVTEVV